MAPSRCLSSRDRVVLPEPGKPQTRISLPALPMDGIIPRFLRKGKEFETLCRQGPAWRGGKVTAGSVTILKVPVTE